jgi:ABC-type proline/glycine betaine transport system ATPase subunit
MPIPVISKPPKRQFLVANPLTQKKLYPDVRRNRITLVYKGIGIIPNRNANIRNGTDIQRVPQRPLHGAVANPAQVQVDR